MKGFCSFLREIQRKNSCQALGNLAGKKEIQNSVLSHQFLKGEVSQKTVCKESVTKSVSKTFLCETFLIFNCNHLDYGCLVGTGTTCTGTCGCGV